MPNQETLQAMNETDFERVTIDELFEELEDRVLAKIGEKALEEFEKSGEKSIPYDKVRKKLGLDG